MTEFEPGDSQNPVSRRRKKWVRPDLQSKVILAALLVAELTLLIHLQLCLAIVWYSQRQAAATEALSGTMAIVLEAFLVSFFIALPLAFLIGTYFSFKFCGPIYRFTQFLQEVLKGRWDRRCQLRDGDELHDVKDLINETLESVTRCARDNQAVLRDFRCLVERHRERFPESEEIEGLLERARQEESAMKERLGDAVEVEKPTPACSGSAVSSESRVVAP